MSHLPSILSRKRTSLTFVGSALLVLVFVGSVPHSYDAKASNFQGNQEQVEDIMKAKLRHAQGLLKGVAMEDFDAIIKDSQALSLLSQESSWNVVQTPDYLQHSIDFRKAADSINKAAKEKNLDGVTLAYFQMTIRCVDCHRHIRAVRTGEPATDDTPLANH